jgi:Leucine-rich repeat (LRR) protein
MPPGYHPQVHLDLSNGKLHHFDSASNLTGVTGLDLSGNELTAVPGWVCELTSLVALDLRDNRLTDLPPAFVNLSALTTLRLDGNRFPDIPAHLPDGIKLFNVYEGRSGW